MNNKYTHGILIPDSVDEGTLEVIAGNISAIFLRNVGAAAIGCRKVNITFEWYDYEVVDGATWILGGRS
jgi:hypothetical protein